MARRGVTANDRSEPLFRRLRDPVDQALLVNRPVHEAVVGSLQRERRSCRSLSLGRGMGSEVNEEYRWLPPPPTPEAGVLQRDAVGWP